MRLLQLSAENYRNIESAELLPQSELTVICGPNGHGKTNLLEAVWLLTGGKSFRGGKDEELVRRGKPFAVLAAKTARDDGKENTLRITVGTRESERPGRYAKANGADAGRAANLAGIFTAVVFDPGHMSLVKGSPEGRRRFLDAALCQLYPGYLTVYRRYLRAMTQKNALLKKFDATPGPRVEKLNLLDVLDAELARQGEEIQRRRCEYLALLSPFAIKTYEEISSGAEALTITYRAGFEAGALQKTLAGRRAEEMRAGCCLIGPHREDFELFLDGESARTFASQGQQRSTVLSLKLAEAAAAKEITGENPVMLLDDVLSELDDSRQSYLLKRMKEKQTFVTCCDEAAFLKTDGDIWHMQNGSLTREQGKTS